MEAIPAPRRVPPRPSLDESAATVNPAKPEAITSVALTSGLSGGSSLGCWWLTTPRLIPNEVLCMCRRLIHQSAWKGYSPKFGAQEERSGGGPVAFCATLSCTPNGYRDPRRSIYAQPGTLDQEVLHRRYVGVRVSGLLPGILLAVPIHNLPLGVAWLFEPPAGIRFLAPAVKDCHAPERF